MKQLFSKLKKRKEVRIDVRDNCITNASSNHMNIFENFTLKKRQTLYYVTNYKD